MGMPIDLVLVRHGQSEGNVAALASRAGDDSLITDPAFRARHSSHWRLTDLGIRQAQQAGVWVRENIGEQFDRYYVSAYTRALETAGHLDLPAPDWYIDSRLRERERGREDLLSSAERELAEESARERVDAPFFWRPLNGENMAEVCQRVRDFIETLHRETSGGRVIVVCHGELMEAFRVTLEHLSPDEYAAWVSSANSLERIRNGHVFHFTRRDPISGTVSPYLSHWRSVYTTDLSLCDPSWRELRRSALSNAELLKLAARQPRLIA